MKCSKCENEIQVTKPGFLVCAHCGTVNISTHSDNGVVTHSSGTTIATLLHASKGRRLRFGNKTAGVALAIAVFVLVGGASAAYVLHGTRRVEAPAQKVAVQRPTSVSPRTTAPVATTPQQPTTPTTTPQPTAQVPPKTQVTPASLASVLTAINQQLAPYGLTATITPASTSGVSWATITEADLTSLQRFKPYLTEEFTKYPKDLVTNSGLKTIGIVKGLKIGSQARAATPDPANAAMIYDANTMANAGSEYSREVVSHEYWHYIDYKTHGSYYYDDATWRACNPSGFTYGAGGSTAYNDPSYAATFHPKPAFITTYSTYGIEEDRAEMFGWLMYNAASVKNLGDSGINCKISRLTTLARQLSPSLTF